MKNAQLQSGIVFRELAPEDWRDLESLFGERGACGGCWCMHWRIPRGGKMWTTVKGEPNRRAFQTLVQQGQSHGILAYATKTLIGWCSFGRRSDFPRTETVKAYRFPGDGSDQVVWAINCFYLMKEYRGIGIAHGLAEAAVRAIRKRRGKIIEAYPVTVTAQGTRLPAAFSFTGTEPMFKRLGFKAVQKISPSRPLYRLHL